MKEEGMVSLKIPQKLKLKWMDMGQIPHSLKKKPQAWVLSFVRKLKKKPLSNSLPPIYIFFEKLIDGKPLKSEKMIRKKYSNT